MILPRCVSGIFPALALLFPALLDAQVKPAMAVEFQIEAPTYQRNLYKKVEPTERDLEEILASIGNQEFGFLSWQPFNPAQDESLAAVLSVHMVEGEPGLLGSSIWLKLTARPKGQAQVFDCVMERLIPAPFIPIGAVQLYSGSWPQSGSAAGLKERVGNVLRRYFSNTSFGQRLYETVLSRIPIGHDIRLFPGPFRNYLALAIRQETLQLDPNSRMKLKPCSRIPGQLKAEGDIRLEPARTRVSEGEVASLLQAKVLSCEFYPWNGDACMQTIPQILEGRLTGGLEIFMMRYVGAPGDTHGNRTTKPWKG